VSGRAIRRSSGCLGFDAECDATSDDAVEVPMVRALDREVVDAVWTAVEPLLPLSCDGYPLGCHR
jgi:hypothetical protein